MTAVDAVYHLVWDVAPVVFLFCVLLGSVLVWTRAPNAATLAQVVGATLGFIGWGLTTLRWSTVNPSDASLYAEMLQSEAMRITMLFAPLVGLALFSIGYLSHACEARAHLLRRCS